MKQEVKQITLQAVKAVVDKYPEILQHLRGDARWHAEVYAWKLGEAPDDDIRLADEKRITNSMYDFLQNQLSRLLKAIKKQYKVIQLSFWDIENQMLWDELSDDFVGVLIHAISGGIDRLTDGVGQLFDITETKDRIIDYARRYRNKWFSQINESSRKFVDKAIEDWLNSGDDIKELIKTLSDPERGMFTKERAKLIAITEVTRLNAWGNALAWEESGAVREFRWNTANDERVCPVCGEREYRVFPLSFIEDNMPAHPRCRCWATPIVDVDMAAERYGNNVEFEPGEFI